MFAVHDAPQEEFIQAIAGIFPGQENITPSPQSAAGLVQQLENAMKQIISIIGLGQGTLAEFDAFIGNSLKEIQRIGGDPLARRCEQKLLTLKDSLYRLEGLVSSDPCENLEQLLVSARMRGAWEQEVRRRDIQDQESLIARLLTRQALLQAGIDACNLTITRLLAQQSLLQRGMDAPAAALAYIKTCLAEEESAMENLLLRSADAHHAVSRATDTLETLRQQDLAATVSFEARIRQELTDQIKADRASAIATVKADLASFNLK